VGLAPGAHGANRTGRMFTGDRSGDWLFAALHRAGFANQPTSHASDDGLQLIDAWVTGAVRCAPPGNRPTPAERDECGAWLDAELRALDNVVAFVALGAYAYVSLWRSLARIGMELPRPRPRFAHGLTVELGSRTISASYHPSQQNTFTGKLTVEMLDDVLEAVRETIDG
jgi:uracil-DNA glycosylase family 4